MVEYSSFLLIASIWVCTVLCVGVPSVFALSMDVVAPTDYFDGNVKTALQELSNIDQSSNVLVKLFRDGANKYIELFDKNKKRLQYAVTKGTEMEKKIQNISRTLKNFTIPLTTELQSELEGIEKRAAAELKKLKEVENVKEIDDTQNKFKEKYAEIRRQIEKLSELALVADSENTQTTTADVRRSKLTEFKAKTIEIIKTAVSVAFTAKKYSDVNTHKMEMASNAFSNIRDDLTKVENMEYHVLLAQKDHFKTDSASLTCSSLAQLFFAIMFVMSFWNFEYTLN